MKDFPALCQGSREGNVSSAIREEAHLDNRMAKWKWSPNYCANQASSAGDQLLPPAVSCRLKIVKGQQLPRRDKPGKIAQQVQAPLKPFSKFLTLITSRQYAA